ncbi:MAG: pentapeptide repeat-containing protein [Cyanobacteria bacterium P01_G01_bin.39]
MADRNLLNLLNQGVDEWNAWRNGNIFVSNLKEELKISPDLSSSNLNGKNLAKVNLMNANLSDANLVESNLTYACLNKVDFFNANLEKANLAYADCYRAYFRKTNLKNANLQYTNLKRTHVLETDFSGAIFTGACLHNWNINNKTILDGIVCDYIYLKYFYLQNEKKERRPLNQNKIFAPGEFTKLFQKVQKTVDLVFSEGIDWQVFLESFEKLKVKFGNDLSIQGIEKKSNNFFVINLETPQDINKTKIEEFFELKYQSALEAREKEYKRLLQAKDRDITYFHQQNTNLMEIIKLQASKPINISQVQGNNIAGDRNIHIGSGNYNELIKGDYVQGNKFDGNKQNLAEAAAEIRAFLKQLEATYPTDSTANQMVVAAKAVEKIEDNSTLKQKAISAVTEGGIAAFEKAIDNPAGAFIAGAVKGWKEVQ